MVSPAPPGAPPGPPPGGYGPPPAAGPPPGAGPPPAVPLAVTPAFSGPVRAGGGSGVLIAVVVVVLGVLLIVGILAAIAIPSFVKYQRRAESAEARTSLSRIAFGATARYDEARAELGAAAAAFPASTDWTPAVPPCETGSPRYPGGEQDWAHPTWQALHFVMATPHRYRYKFTAAGTGASASFVAEAEGDLNCNGVRAHFVRRGRVVDGRVELAPLESTNPLD